MVAGVETMAYNKAEVPWHKMGFPVDGNLSPEEMAKAAKIDWTVSKQKLYLASKKVVPGRFALVRDSDESLMSIVGDTYKPVQNLDAVSFFKKFVDAGHMSMETAGALYQGRYIWGLARINQSFNLGRKDKINGYLLLSQPHLVNKAMDMRLTTVRVVCQNTFQLALRQGAINGRVFRMPHQVKFDDKMKEIAEAALEISTSQFRDLKVKSEALAGKKANDDDVVKFFFDVMRFDDKEREKAIKDDEIPKTVKAFQQALTFAPGQELSTAKGTWWGAFNAVTYVVDHEMGRTRDVGLKNAWFGTTGNAKRRAWELAVKAAA